MMLHAQLEEKIYDVTCAIRREDMMLHAQLEEKI